VTVPILSWYNDNMTTQRYDIEGEVIRLTSECKIKSASPQRDRYGRWHRDPAGEYDWLYALAPLERAYISRNYMSKTGTEVDVLASEVNLDVDEWADSFIATVRATRARKLRDLDPLDEAYEELSWYDDDVNVDELVGPVEVAELLQVKVNTIAQWRLRFPDFPEPVAVISGTRIWRRGQIEAWATDKGRAVIAPAD